MTKKILLIFYFLIFFIQQLHPASTCCFTPRNISTDSMLELSLVNYHRYHSLDKQRFSFYAKPFFIGATHAQRNSAGVLFTGYFNATKAIWLGINTAAMANKINNRHAGGLDDIQFKLAYDIAPLEDCHATGYLVATAPTGKKSYTCPLVQPQVGSRNGSLGLGINLDAVAGEIGDYELSWLFDLKYRHTFNPHFYYTPRNTIDLWTALNLPINQFNLEIGYDFWWQQSYAHIFSSSQKLYADLGYTLKLDGYSALFGLGAAYEFATKDSALEQWTVWLTAGICF